jgi:hypothetical protein
VLDVLYAALTSEAGDDAADRSRELERKAAAFRAEAARYEALKVR